MKKVTLFIVCILFFCCIHNNIIAQDNKSDVLKNTALIIIDIQNFYFAGGALPLVKPEAAALNAQKLLKAFRAKGKLVVHVKHISQTGSDIYKILEPSSGEKIVSKNKANAFINTDLLEYLNKNHIENLILCGMQTHMCLEATTRAASDLDFKCTVIDDACATRDLNYGGVIVSAKNVHYSTLSTLNGTYAKIETTMEFLNKLK